MACERGCGWHHAFVAEVAFEEELARQLLPFDRLVLYHMYGSCRSGAQKFNGGSDIHI